MIKKPESQAQWLREIDKGQNIEGIETAVLSLWNTRFVKWFKSKVITPTISMFNYNSTTGKLEFAHGSRVAATDVVDAATSVLTGPAGFVRRVYYACRANSTRAARYTLTANISGVAVTFTGDDALTVAIGEFRTLIQENVGSYFDAAAQSHKILSYVELRPGETVTITDTTYVAADGQITFWVYEDVRI